MAAIPPVCEFDLPAPNFSLLATDGKTYTRDAVMGPAGLVVMFICNHCPYVISIASKLARDGAVLQKLGFGVVAICSNDADEYPQDSYENMVLFAREHGFTFPYLVDETQQVAKAYGAVCTPDFFGYNAALGLQYRGRLDASGRNPSPENEPSALVDALTTVAETGQGPAAQIASMGCSIKWKDD